jgi:dTDP-glucose 4,6-dehydratase
MTTAAPQFRTRHAVVAGGAGFVGAHLCDRLVRDGWRVTCLDNFISGRPDNVAHLHDNRRFRFLRHDITEPLPDLGDVDLVCHLASIASPADYLRYPVQTLRAGSTGTERLLEFADDQGARFLLTSTSEVYGDPLQHPQSEDYWGNVNPIGPRSVYDESKRYAEALTMAYHRAHGTTVRIARIFNTYGPGMRADDGRMIPAFIQQALAGEPLTVTGSGEQTRSVCYVDDTVEGLLALVSGPLTGPVNIGNPQERTVNEIAEEVRAAIGSESPISHIEAMQDDPQRRCPDIHLAKEQLGWEPRVELDEGLRRTIAWFAQQQSGHAPAAAGTAV